MRLPTMWTNNVGYALVWERDGEVLLLADHGGAVWHTTNPSVDADLGTLYRSEEAAREALEQWSASEDYIEGSDFVVCYIQAAYVATSMRGGETVDKTPAIEEDDDLEDIELGEASCELGEACESCQ